MKPKELVRAAYTLAELDLIKEQLIMLGRSDINCIHISFRNRSEGIELRGSELRRALSGFRREQESHLRTLEDELRNTYNIEI